MGLRLGGGGIPDEFGCHGTFITQRVEHNFEVDELSHNWQGVGDVRYEMKIPDAISPIAAYRGWTLQDGKLLAFNDFEWTAGTNTAECIYSYDTDHKAPGELCSCGFYGVSGIEYISNIPARDNKKTILGQVEFWGKVIPGTMGYRAEKAKITGLFVPTKLLLNLKVRKLAKKYDLEFLPMPEGVSYGASYDTRWLAEHFED